MSTRFISTVLVSFMCCWLAPAFDIESHRLTSMMAAVYTPMRTWGGLELNLDLIPSYAKWCAQRNITNVMPGGSNGESLLMSVDERKRLTVAWAKAGRKSGLRVYIHIGSTSLVDARELAKHAASTEGVHGIVCMSPVYYKPTLSSLHSFLASIAEMAPKLPLWYYHYPDATGVLPGGAHTLLELNEQKPIPNFAGIKFTDYNLLDFSLCVQVASGKYNMVYGRDEQALSAMEIGAGTAVSSTINYSPTLRHALELYAKGDIIAARDQQRRNVQLCSILGDSSFQGKNLQKNIMRMTGVDVGTSRLPNVDLDDAEYQDLKTKLTKLKLLDLPDTSLVELV